MKRCAAYPFCSWPGRYPCTVPRKDGAGDVVMSYICVKHYSWAHNRQRPLLIYPDFPALEMRR